MAKITLSIDYEIVCPNCFQPLDFIIHDAHEPNQLAISFCTPCVEAKIKSAVDSERQKIQQMMIDYCVKGGN